MNPSTTTAPRWFGDYRLDSVIGRGGMGQVWRAFHAPTNRFVALKVLPAELAGDEEYRRRFEREARVAARLRNPHLVAIHSYGRVGDQLYIDMALVEGVDVSALLRERGPMPPARAVELLAQIGAAVDSAHAAGLVHRDIKPGNILVDANGFAYLIDFGIAKPNDETGLTGTGAALGTIAYMAPERFEGVASAAADIYALGCVLVECITGAKVFTGESAAEQVFGHLYKPPPRLGELRPGTPAALDDVVERALAKDPGRRFPSATEFVAAARRALGRGAAAWNHGTAATVPAAGNSGPDTAGAPAPDGSGSDPAASAITPRPGFGPADPTLTPAASGRMSDPRSAEPATTPRPAASTHPSAPVHRSPDRHTAPGYNPERHPVDHGTAAPAAPPPRTRHTRNLLLAAAAILTVFAVATAATLALRTDSPDTTGTPTTAPPNAPATLPAEYEGRWTGRARDALLQFDIVVELRAGRVGEEIGTASNTSTFGGTRCERAETLESVTESGITLRARLTGGAADCVDDDSVSTLAVNPDGTLDYSFPNPLGMDISGTLTKN